MSQNSRHACLKSNSAVTISIMQRKVYYFNLKGKLHHCNDSMSRFQGFQIFGCEFVKRFLFQTQVTQILGQYC